LNLYINYEAAICTVHPDGIPDGPVGSDDIEAALVNVPVECYTAIPNWLNNQMQKY
jgi:hypothetical protein